MSKGRMTFNLQDSKQMEEFKKLFRRQYGPDKTNVTRVEEDEEHIAGVRHLRPAPGEDR